MSAKEQLLIFVVFVMWGTVQSIVFCIVQFVELRVGKVATVVLDVCYAVQLLVLTIVFNNIVNYGIINWYIVAALAVGVLIVRLCYDSINGVLNAILHTVDKARIKKDKDAVE